MKKYTPNGSTGIERYINEGLDCIAMFRGIDITKPENKSNYKSPTFEEDD